MAQKPVRLIGSFVFRNEGDGCLTSKYHHEDSPDCPFAEACKLTAGAIPNDRFVSIYRTVWLEDTTHVPAELIIERHPLNPVLYKLIWHAPGLPANIIFLGSGMIDDNLLVGAYWDEN